jgi:hypothetical protein
MMSLTHLLLLACILSLSSTFLHAEPAGALSCTGTVNTGLVNLSYFDISTPGTGNSQLPVLTVHADSADFAKFWTAAAIGVQYNTCILTQGARSYNMQFVTIQSVDAVGGAPNAVATVPDYAAVVFKFEGLQVIGANQH